MEVAPSNKNGNYKGGTYGLTRTKRVKKDTVWTIVPKNHSGLDLSASVGTPVFAMYSGTVVKAYSNSPDYNVSSGVEAFGNQLQIQTTDGNGRSFIVQYAHLNYGTPISTNPRTGKPFQEGDCVYQGDLIGYTGKTGNAYNVPYTHLHLGIKSNGKWANPADYINGTINTQTINSTKGKIDNIKCD